MTRDTTLIEAEDGTPADDERGGVMPRSGSSSVYVDLETGLYHARETHAGPDPAAAGDGGEQGAQRPGQGPRVTSSRSSHPHAGHSSSRSVCPPHAWHS